MHDTTKGTVGNALNSKYVRETISLKGEQLQGPTLGVD